MSVQDSQQPPVYPATSAQPCCRTFCLFDAIIESSIRIVAMNQIIQLSGKFLYRISRVWFTSKTTEPIVIEELEEALPRQMVEEQDADTPAAFYTATPGYSSSYQTPGRLNPDTNFGKALT